MATAHGMQETHPKSCQRCDDLTAAILDIDAHAAPYGEDKDGFVAGGYIVSVGAIHRALGLIGHSSAKVRKHAVAIDLAHGADCEGCKNIEEIVLDAVAATRTGIPREQWRP